MGGSQSFTEYIRDSVTCCGNSVPYEHQINTETKRQSQTNRVNNNNKKNKQKNKKKKKRKNYKNNKQKQNQSNKSNKLKISIEHEPIKPSNNVKSSPASYTEDHSTKTQLNDSNSNINV